jgi:peptidoglycan hydrolase-like protein with peptidoglycan-binding domain
VLKNAPLAGQAELERIAGGKGALRKGSKGAGVKTVQEALMALKYNVPGGADGIFGNGLEGAVEAFQKNKRLAADGIVGPGTLKALDAALAAGAIG